MASQYRPVRQGHFNPIRTTLGARENIKLQKRMSWLTGVILTLTIVIAILTAVTTFMVIKEGNLSWPW